MGHLTQRHAWVPIDKEGVDGDDSTIFTATFACSSCGLETRALRLSVRGHVHGAYPDCYHRIHEEPDLDGLLR